ncbi:TetR/AcrR family transcriptional regulator [Rhodospirillaceae bacterium KN72]|uniref:TetR/AcrR family transcriptional regulator n=1 Tax=Pacificispira spongiicola TaxID=2729598 RepID=A0A7Y0E1E4_9PROT|nr:TetR/AcrR family transcriptional regulator [Pacificispira spongiicola]NMM44656.1 TetR/AcrR family transcriptional regulator [Pacificispira spongiicola]
MNDIRPENEPPPYRRRTQKERREETRARLLDATIQVILHHGYAGMSTALVDAEAGVSSGARNYHFPTKLELVAEATRNAYDHALELGRRRAEQALTSDYPLNDLLDDLKSIYFDWPYLVAQDVVIAARTDAALMDKVAPILGTYHEALRKTWTELFVKRGLAQADAETVFDLALNLIRGMGINRVWRQDKDHQALLIAQWAERYHPLFK